MVPKKSKSKRISLSMKHRIERNVRSHNRKQRKLARKGLAQGKRGARAASKDFGIPNLHPFKQELLQQVENRKRLQAEQLLVQKERRKQQLAKLRQTGGDQAQMKLLATDAGKRANMYHRQLAEIQAAESSGGARAARNQRAFYAELKKVIGAADVIIQVLDARDPLGCRCEAVERMVLDQGKRVVLLLNKIDLVPRDVVQKWLTYLRGFFPTLAFKASTQSQRQHLSQAGVSAENASASALKSSECFGADNLVQLLKNYCRQAGVKTGITAGIVGYPNVGKSSVINSLKRTRVAQVGNTPGVTRVMQEVQLDKLVRLLDCPGIVFSSDISNDAGVLRRVLKVEQLDDPVGCVGAVVSRCDHKELQTIYGIPSFTDPANFLELVARRKGKLLRGGELDTEAAAKIVLQDWNDGRIPYCTLPPSSEKAHVSAEILPAYGKEFDMTLVLKDDAETIARGTSGAPTTMAAVMPASQMGRDIVMGDEDGDDDDDDDDDDDEEDDDDDDDDGDEDGMDVDDDEDEDDDDEASGDAMSRGDSDDADVSINPRTPLRVTRVAPALSHEEAAVNPQANQQLRKAQKQQKKQQRKQQGKARPGDAYSLDVFRGAL